MSEASERAKRVAGRSDGGARGQTEQLVFSSRLAAAPDAVWARVITPEGVNDELRPLARMTFPASVKDLSPENVPIGSPICTSWFLLFGFVPFDRARVTLVAIADRSFVEQSPMLSLKLWRHERSVGVDGAGCRLTDTLRFEPRLGVMMPLVRWLVGWLFRNRHARLTARFGRAP